MLFHSGYTGYCLQCIPATVQNGVPHLLTAAAAQLRLERVQGSRRRLPGVGAAHAHNHLVCWAFPGALGGGRKVCARLAPRVLRRHVLSSRTVWDVCIPLPSKRGRRCQPDTQLPPWVLWHQATWPGRSGRGLVEWAGAGPQGTGEIHTSVDGTAYPRGPGRVVGRGEVVVGLLSLSHAASPSFTPSLGWTFAEGIPGRSKQWLLG